MSDPQKMVAEMMEAIQQNMVEIKFNLSSERAIEVIRFVEQMFSREKGNVQ